MTRGNPDDQRNLRPQVRFPRWFGSPWGRSTPPSATFRAVRRQWPGGRVKVIPSLDASPDHRDQASGRLEQCRARARETGAWIVYVNAVGGQDELVFDGGSMVVSPDGELAWHAVPFEEDLLVVDLDVGEAPEGYPGPAVGTRDDAQRPPVPDASRPPWPEGAE